tara:strand:- start:11013 stop:11459 length:447 start_codon:yes stop_codon:yes gene_type:complete
MIDDLLTNLTTIGKISPGDKLSVEKGKIYISAVKLNRPFARWFTSQDRYSSIDFLKSTVDFAADYIITRIELFKTTELLPDKTILHETQLKAKDELKIIMNVYVGTLKGLEELKGTYQDDRSILSSLDVIMNKISKIEEEYNITFNQM